MRAGVTLGRTVRDSQRLRISVERVAALGQREWAQWAGSWGKGAWVISFSDPNHRRIHSTVTRIRLQGVMDVCRGRKVGVRVRRADGADEIQERGPIYASNARGIRCAHWI